MRYVKKRNRGFTLIEVLVIIVVMSVLFGIGAKMVDTTMRSWNMITVRKQMLFRSRMGMNRMVREIRMADTSKVTTCNATNFKFTNINNTSIWFHKVDDNLKMTDDILVTGLNNTNGLVFTYLDPNGDPTGTPAQIRRVKIRLNLQKGDQTFAYESQARIRNP